jgi:5'-3' exonuclease
MNVHVIVDFMHIYYKYFFQLQAGRMPKLSTVINANGIEGEIDTTLVYYSLRDIENIRASIENGSNELTMSICFDSKSKRKDNDDVASAEYKSDRPNRLGDGDLDNLKLISELVEKAGYNIYKEEGYEADDIVNYLANTYKNEFDYTVIYTNDKDILVNIDDKVGVMRFKQGKGYTRVTKENYEAYLENEFGVFIPYNALGLYLSTAGDTADKIKGIHKFGKVAFKKLITKVGIANEIDWSSCGDYDKLFEVVKMCKEFLTDEQYEQMCLSFNMVRNTSVDELGGIEKPLSKSTIEKRKEAYLPYSMNSLI